MNPNAAFETADKRLPEAACGSVAAGAVCVYFQVASRAMGREETGGGGGGKFSVPGVPPTCALAVHDCGRAEFEAAEVFDKVTPPPSGAMGHSPLSP